MKARLVDGGCHNVANRRSGKVWRATKEQRIPHEKTNINVLRERPEEDVGVYAQEECSIPTWMGKYIPVQTNHGVTGDILIEISNKTMSGLILPEIV